MNLKTKVLFVFVLTTNLAFAQNTIKMTNQYGSQNQEIQNLIDFENIYIEKLNFESENIIGKHYQVHIEEFKNGKFMKASTLFDGSETDYFKIDSRNDALQFFFKISDGKLKTFIRGKKFGSKKSYFKLYGDSDEYALKDFFGDKKELNIDLQRKNAVFAILTPTIHEDGSSSYCEVAQSDIAPEKLGAHFKIPHYFLITIAFK